VLAQGTGRSRRDLGSKGDRQQILRDCELSTRFGEITMRSTRSHAIRSASAGVSDNGTLPRECRLWERFHQRCSMVRALSPEVVLKKKKKPRSATTPHTQSESRRGWERFISCITTKGKRRRHGGVIDGLIPT